MRYRILLFILISLVVIGSLGVTFLSQAYPSFWETKIFYPENQGVDYAKELTFDFSQPVRANQYSGISVVPSIPINVRWENSNKRLIISPQKFWQPETKYTIHLPSGKNIFFVPFETNNFTFSTVDLPKIKTVSPTNGARDVLVDIEDPLVVEFTKSTMGFFVKFDLNPYSEMTYKNNLDKTQFQLLPAEKIKDGTTYEMKIYIKYMKDSDENYKEIYSGTFETLPPPPASWEKDFTLRLEQAKKFTKAKITEGKYIDIDLTHQILSIFENGQMLGDYIISSGKRGMDTPKGNFSIHNKAPRVWSKRYGLYMPYWMAVASDGSFGLHELPEWPGGYKEGANHLGIPVSHGCIRLGIGAAQRVYEWTEVGTPVIIY